MRKEDDFSSAKRAKDVPHLANLQAEAARAGQDVRLIGTGIAHEEKLLTVSLKGTRRLLEPLENKYRLAEFLATLEPSTDNFPEIEDPPIEPEDIF
ncbi:MAG: hypothetical protein ABJC13_02135 [Acidobacteriota bacterium]